MKWSKRCKDKSLIGTVKEVFTQVSHSKKWASHKEMGEDGKEHFVKSYSLLQDRFFKHLRECGYQDIQRGEKGSTEQNLTATQFKVSQEEKRLQETARKVEKSEKTLSTISDKQAKIKAIDTVEIKTVLMDKSKVVLDKSEFEDIKILAQKQIATDKKEKKLLSENKELRQENQALHKENTLQKKELSEFKSVTNQLHAGKEKARIRELEKFQDVVLKFLDFMGIREKFEQFRKSLHKQRKQFVRLVMDSSLTEQNREMQGKRKSLDKLNKRVAEIDTVIENLYIDKVSGKISGERFDKMANRFEAEQAELKEQVDTLQVALSYLEQESVNVDRFLTVVRKYTEVKELTHAIIHEFIDKIIIHQPDSPRKNRVQKVEIIYNNIGVFDLSALEQGQAV